MSDLTINLPDDLAARIEPAARWIPTVLEVSLLGLSTGAAATAAELVRFLASNPSPQEVLDYHASEKSQTRLRRLLALNLAGLLGEHESQELDEIEQLEHLVTMLKARATQLSDSAA